MHASGRCAQCLLPLGRRPLTLRVGQSEECFCCYGCYLVLRLTSERGPAGAAHGLGLRLGLALFFAMNAMVFSLPGYFPYVYGETGDGVLFLTALRWMALLLTVPVLLLLGVPVLWQAVRDARAHIVRTDALVAIGTLAAYAVSVHHTLTAAPHVYFDTVAMLLIFVALGRYLEARAKADAGAVLTHLQDTSLQPVRVLRNGEALTLSSDRLCVDDVVILSPGDACPVDGIVLWGRADFDESTLTGESLPIPKTPGAAIIAGSIDLDGNIHVRATRVGAASTLGRLRRRVEDALAEQSPWQRTADRLASVLVFTAPLLALVAFLYCARHGSVDEALLTALAVLVVACPCAFGIATPAALWVGIDEAARRGIQLRSPAVLERLALARTVWFDKTGTLSSGQLQLVAIQPGSETTISERDVLSIARTLEATIAHPIARALRVGGDAAEVATDLRYHPGLGVEGRIRGTQWVFGSRALLMEFGLVPPPDLVKAPDRTEWSSWLGIVNDRDTAVVARFDFADQPRAAVGDTLGSLQQSVLRVGVLSGAATLGEQWSSLLGGLDIHVGLLPADKAAAVRDSPRPVVMVGDGLNDAPALAAADVGIALGVGRALTREAADVSVLSNDLGAVAWLFQWSRRVRRTMLINMSWALLYNVVALSAAAVGALNPVIAALAMVGSSTCIVANARRLRHASGRTAPLARTEPHPPIDYTVERPQRTEGPAILTALRNEARGA